MRASGFAVIELATTGVFPHGRDRLLELGVVQLDARGAREGAWSVSLDAERSRSAGRAESHTLQQIAPMLVQSLSGRVLVAHNAAFSIRFLMAELERVTPWIAPEPVTLCTMQLSRAIVPGTGRSLAACCEALGVVPDRSASVRGRAEAVARLLSVSRSRGGCEGWWNEQLDDALGCEWPRLAVDGAYSGCLATTSRHIFEVELPPREAPDHVVDYLALLDRCIADRCAAAVEPAALAACAAQLGVRAEEQPALHRAWFDDLARSAYAAGRSVPAAREELLQVARMLALPAAEVVTVLSESAAA